MTTLAQQLSKPILYIDGIKYIPNYVNIGIAGGKLISMIFALNSLITLNSNAHTIQIDLATGVSYMDSFYVIYLGPQLYTPIYTNLVQTVYNYLTRATDETLEMGESVVVEIISGIEEGMSIEDTSFPLDR